MIKCSSLCCRLLKSENNKKKYYLESEIETEIKRKRAIKRENIKVRTQMKEYTTKEKEKHVKRIGRYELKTLAHIYTFIYKKAQILVNFCNNVEKYVIHHTL